MFKNAEDYYWDNRVKISRLGAEGRGTVGTTVGDIPPDDLKMKMELQAYKCMYCKTKITFYTCHIDHIYPLAKGGEHYLYNLALTCGICNHGKRDMTLQKFCQRRGYDFDKIAQEIADINHRLHTIVFGDDWYNHLDDYE